MNRYLSSDEQVDMGGASTNGAAMREDDRMALNTAVQHNTARAQRAESFLEVVRKGRASVRPTAGDAAGVTTDSAQPEDQTSVV